VLEPEPALDPELLAAFSLDDVPLDVDEPDELEESDEPEESDGDEEVDDDEEESVDFEPDDEPFFDPRLSVL